MDFLHQPPETIVVPASLPRTLYRDCQIGCVIIDTQHPHCWDTGHWASLICRCIMKERPASEGRGCDEATPPLRGAVQGFAPLRRRCRVTALMPGGKGRQERA